MKLEEFISKHREEFDEGTLPKGFEESFALLSEELKSRNHIKRPDRFKIIQFAATFTAAAIVIFTVGYALKYGEAGNGYESAIKEYLSHKEDIMNIELNSENKSLLNAAEFIISDTPIEETLPSCLPKEDKEKILETYYSKKNKGLQRIKALLAEIPNVSEN